MMVMSLTSRKATRAQAKRLAYFWSDWRPLAVAETGYVEPTTRVLIRHGWLEMVGDGEPYPNGTPTALYAVSDAGLRALGEFLVRTYRQ